MSCNEELKERDALQKKWDAKVAAAVEEIKNDLLKSHPGFKTIFFFGAMGIDPKHLAIWCFFNKDEDLKKATEEQFTGLVQKAARQALCNHGYPSSLADAFHISFATDEDVQRTCGGDYRLYLQ